MRSSSLSNHRVNPRTARKLHTAARVETLEQRRFLTAILSDQTLTGSISAPAEVDEFTFDADVGDSIIAFVAETATAAFDPRIELIAPNAALLTSDAGEEGADILLSPLPQTGTYTLRISDSGANDTGDYTLTLAKLPGVQTPNSDGGALPLSGPRINGTIAVGDLDVFTIAASPGDQVLLNVVEDSANPDLNLNVLVYGPTGTQIIQDFGEVGVDVSFTATTSGSYYLVVKDLVNDNVGFGLDGDIDTGNYALLITKIPGPQLDDGTDGGSITSGPRRIGNIILGDMDVYTISGAPGDQVILNVVEQGQDTGFDVHVLVYGPSGTLIDQDFGDVGIEISFAPTSSGTHYVVIKDLVNDNVGFGFDGDFETGTYALTMAKLAGPQTDDASDGGPLGSGPRVRGTIALGDMDVFTIAANSGDRVILTAVEDDGSDFEPEIRVFAPDGTPIVTDAGTLGTEVIFTPASSGTFYVVVKDLISDNVGFGFDGDFEASQYILTMAKIPGVQSDDGSDGGPLASGQRVTGTIATGDIDVYRMSLAIGDSIVGVVRNAELAELETLVTIYSPTGVQLDTSNGTTDFFVSSDAVTLAGTYYIVVRDVISDNVGFGLDGDIESGQYSLTFVKTPGAQPSDPDSAALVSAQVRAGAVSMGDIDVYTYEATAGQAFTVNLGETTTTAFEPTFRLHNPSGTLVTTQTGAPNTTFNVANPVAGTYTIFVYDANGNTSGPYSIGLSAAVGADNFAPRVLDVQYRFDTAPPDLRVIVSENVGTSFAATDVEITNLDTNQPVDNGLLAMSYDTTNDLFKVTFPAFLNRVLPDGNYRLRVLQNNLTDAAGNPLDQDISHDFFTLAGDANRDRRVTLPDFNILAGSFGKSLRVFSRGDFNYDGLVTLQDFNILAGNFGKMVASASTSSSSPFGNRTIGAGDDRDDELSVLLA